MIAFDNADNTTGNGTSSRTKSFTVGSGDNRFLIVTGLWLSGGLALPTIDYNGDALSLFKSHIISGLSDYTYAFWYLANPDSGSNTLTITPTPPTNIASTTSIFLVDSYSGVDQGSSIEQGTDNQTNNTGTTLTSTATTVAVNAWMIGSFTSISSTNTLTASTGSIRKQATNTGEAGMLLAIMDNGPIASPGSTNAVATVASSTQWQGFGQSLKPAADTTFIPFSMLL